ncbi:MAG: EAL domain-containing protein, partial [Gammaproteobacteria bacterium]|nr:EAL domain-containing protein [Gammaproteobacteria bacterium]
LHEMLQSSTRTLRELIHVSEQPLAFLHAGQILEANPALTELLAIPSGEDPRGKSFTDFLAEAEREEFTRLLAEQAQATVPMVEIEIRGLRADGEIVPLRLDLVPAVFEARDGLLVTVSAAASAPERKARPAGDAPASSGRLTLVEGVNAARRADAGGGVICVLVENQSKLDEVLGLGGREQLANELLKRISASVSGDAVVARIADDTFGVYLPGMAPAKLREAAAKTAAMASRDVVRIGQHTVRPACLSGVATVSDQYKDGMAVLEAAYDACRRPVTAQLGPSEPDAAQIAEYARIADELKAGMSDGRLSLLYQPIVRLQGEPIELYEVFIRLKDRGGKVVPTRAVVSAAEQYDLIDDLDLWVIQRAIEILQARQKQGRETHLFVKLSDECMDDIQIPLTITRELKARNVDPARLIVELSETAASGNLKKSRAFVESLKKIGCPTALDHFGLSLSAFQLLEDVPATFLKLDASLVNRLEEDPDAYRQVLEICQKARDLGKQTIASYLDNPGSLPKLYQAGVDLAQGYYIQEPGESMDFEFSILVE